VGRVGLTCEQLATCDDEPCQNGGVCNTSESDQVGSQALFVTCALFYYKYWWCSNLNTGIIKIVVNLTFVLLALVLF